MRDLYNIELDFQSIKPQVITNGTINGAEVDMAGFESAVGQVDSGSYTDGVHTWTLQESDTSGSGFTDVAAADLQGGTTVLIDAADEDDRVYERGYLGVKRFIRWEVVTTGSSTGLIAGASIRRNNANDMPVTHPSG